MRFATGLPGVNLYPPVAQPLESAMGAEDFQLVARTADEAGFDCISVPEHIVAPDEMVELMGSTRSHAMTVMAFVAGANTRIEVDSAVIVLPHHQPVVLAKAIATLDVLSGGRVRARDPRRRRAPPSARRHRRPAAGHHERAGGHRRRRPPAVPRRHPDGGPAPAGPLARRAPRRAPLDRAGDHPRVPLTGRVPRRPAVAGCSDATRAVRRADEIAEAEGAAEVEAEHLLRHRRSGGGRRSDDAGLRERIAKAAATGGASLYASGIFTGLRLRRLALLLTSQSRSIRTVRLVEVSLNDHHPVPDVTMDGMGFARPFDFEPFLGMPGVIPMVWRGPIGLIAQGLGVELDEIRGRLDRQLTDPDKESRLTLGPREGHDAGERR